MVANGMLFASHAKRLDVRNRAAAFLQVTIQVPIVAHRIIPTNFSNR